MADNMQRIVNNIKTLLENGQFQGAAAPAIAEALSFLDQLIRTADEQQKEVSDSNRDGKDEGGVQGDRVPNRRGQGCKKKSK